MSQWWEWNRNPELIILLQWCHQEPLLLVTTGALHVTRSIHACFSSAPTLLNIIPQCSFMTHTAERASRSRLEMTPICGSKLFQFFWYQGLFLRLISYLLHKIVHIFRVSEIKACQQIPFAQCWENLLFKHRYHNESAEMVIKCCNDRNIIDRV